MEDTVIVVLVIVLAHIYAKELNLDIDIKVYEPHGLYISLPDSPGIEAVYFWANINEEFTSTSKGKIKLGAVQPTDGEWVIRAENLELKNGDIINYVLFIKRNGEFERYEKRRFVVTGFQESHNGVGSTIPPSQGVSTVTPTISLASVTSSYEHNSTNFQSGTRKSTDFPPSITVFKVDSKTNTTTNGTDFSYASSTTSPLTSFGTFNVTEASFISHNLSSSTTTTPLAPLRNSYEPNITASTVATQSQSNISRSTLSAGHISTNVLELYSITPPLISIGRFNVTEVGFTPHSLPSSTTKTPVTPLTKSSENNITTSTIATNFQSEISRSTLGVSHISAKVLELDSITESTAFKGTNHITTPPLTSNGRLNVTEVGFIPHNLPSSSTTTPVTPLTNSYELNITASTIATNFRSEISRSTLGVSHITAKVSELDSIPESTTTPPITSSRTTPDFIPHTLPSSTTTPVTPLTTEATTAHTSLSQKTESSSTSIRVSASDSKIHVVGQQMFPKLTTPSSSSGTITETVRTPTGTNRVPASIESMNLSTSTVVNTVSSITPGSATTTAAQIVTTMNNKVASKLLPTDDCSHKIRLKTKDFSMEFYGNVDMNSINPNMIASLILNGCDVKYATAKRNEPNTVQFDFS